MWCRRTEEGKPDGLVFLALFGGADVTFVLRGAFVQRLTVDLGVFMGVFFCSRVGENRKALRGEPGLQGP